MATELLLIAVLVGVLLLLLTSGINIYAAVGLAAVTVIYLWMGPDSLYLVGWRTWRTLNSFPFTAIPLFVFMGLMLEASGLIERVYAGLAPVFERAAGGLLHSNIAVATIFAASSGSVVASTAVIGTVALPGQIKRGYDRKLSLGTIGGGGMLAPLIPPSIFLIIYGLLVEESVVKLFMAGMVPGLLLAGLFATYVWIRVKKNPRLAGSKVKVLPWGKSLLRTVTIWPIIVLIVIVLGSIYAGIATPTEAAGVGSVGSLILAAVYRNLTWGKVRTAALQTVRMTSMIMFIFIGAVAMTVALANQGVPVFLMNFVIGLDVAPVVILAIVYLFYIMAGMVMSELAVVVMTVPTIFPTMIALGYDPIWFGVVLCMLNGLGVLSPPYGIGLFILHSLHPERPFSEVVYGVLPFCGIILFGLLLVTVFPELVLFLPDIILGT